MTDKTVFICVDLGDNSYAAGDTLEKAYLNYREEVNDEATVEELSFYEATLIEVEFKVVKKEVPVKVNNNKGVSR